MAARQIFEINGQIFNSKQALIKYISSVLNKYQRGQTISSEDFLFISELAKRHPDYDEIVENGIHSIIVNKAELHTTNCFWVVGANGSLNKFSTGFCHSKNLTPEQKFKLSARTAIEAQTSAYYYNYMKNNRDTFISEMSGDTMEIKSAHVDHTPPYTFKQIIKNFVESRDINFEEIEYIGLDKDSFKREFKEEALRADFVNYHLEVANLRVVSATENLTQEKK